MNAIFIRREPTPIPVIPLDEVCFPTDHRVKVEDSFWWIAWAGKKPIAYAGLRPCKEPCNLGLGFLCRAGVLPEYRGQGLQKKLIRLRLAAGKRLGFTEIVTYVAVWNSPSINSLVSCGFKFYRPEVRYGGSDSVYLRKVIAT